MRKADPALREKRRLQIVDAATACFIANGFHQTSMQNLSEATGLSMGLLYRYFANKNEIIEAVAQIDRDALIAAIDALADSGDILKAWSELLIVAITELSDPKTAALINEIYAEAGRNDALLTSLREHDQQLLQCMKCKLQTQQANAAIPATLDTATVTIQLMALVDGMVARQMMAPFQNPSGFKAVIRMSVGQIIGN